MRVDHCLINGAGVVVKPSRDRKVDSEILLGNPETAHVLCYCGKFADALVEELRLSCHRTQRLDRFRVRTLMCQQFKKFARSLHVDPQTAEFFFNGLPTDLLELVDNTKDFGFVAAETEEFKESAENLSVVDPDRETGNTEFCENPVDYSGYFRVVYE